MWLSICDNAATMRPSVSPGDRVELSVEGAGGRHELLAIVADVGPSRIVFALPDLGALPSEIEVGCRIAIRPLEGPAAPWRHAVATAVASSPVPVVEVGPLADEKAQRRGFFRIDACLPVTCFAPDAGDAARPPVTATGVTENISAGGLRIVTNTALKVRDAVRIRVDVPSALVALHAEALEADARVRRVFEVLGRSPPHYVVALQLLFTREPRRDQWVQLVFELQRAARK